MTTWRTKTKEQWLESADEVRIVDMHTVKNHSNKWIARLAPKVLEAWGFYVYFQEGKTYLLILAEQDKKDYQIFQTAKVI